MWLKSNIYFWRGINYLGDIYSGYIVADSRIKAMEVLASSKVITKYIARKITFKTFLLGNYIAAKDLLAFTQQTSVTLVSGLSLAHAIKLAVNYQSNNIFKYLLNNIISDVESGMQFSASIRKYPDIFNAFYCNMVEIAEKSGEANLVFVKLTNYLQQIEQLKQRLQKILLYPALLLGLTLVVLASIVLFVIPQFSTLYVNLGGDLPRPTQFILSLTNFINNNLLLLLISALTFVVSNIFIYKHSPRVVRLIDKILLFTPLFGKFLHKIILAKCINILYVTYTSGTPLPGCLQYAKLISKNHLYINFIDNLSIKISSGESFKVALKHTGFFPISVINILGLGDESSNLEEMLKYLANFYDIDIQRTFDTLSALSEPLIMVFLGLIIGFLVFTIYYPIINIGTLV